jgi:hypothetical protein
MRDKYLGTIVTTYLPYGRVSPAHTKVVVFVRAGHIFLMERYFHHALAYLECFSGKRARVCAPRKQSITALKCRAIFVASLRDAPFMNSRVRIVATAWGRTFVEYH